MNTPTNIPIPSEQSESADDAKATPSTGDLHLVRIFAEVADGEIVHSVDARELYKGLQVGKDFSNWIKDRISNYGFEEGKDYSPILANNTGSRGQPRKEYKLSMDMAKELCMLERNETGSKFRKYFIECEKEFRKVSQHLAENKTVSDNSVEALKLMTETVREFRNELKDMRSQLNSRQTAPADQETPQLIYKTPTARLLRMGVGAFDSWRLYGQDFPFRVYTSTPMGHDLYDENEIRAYIRNGLRPDPKYSRSSTGVSPVSSSSPQSGIGVPPVSPSSSPTSLPATSSPSPEDDHPRRIYLEDQTEPLFTMTDIAAILTTSQPRLAAILFNYRIIEKRGTKWILTQFANTKTPIVGKLVKFQRVNALGEREESEHLMFTEAGVSMCRDLVKQWTDFQQNRRSGK